MLGPIVVVAERPATDLIDLLGQAGAFPVVEARVAEAPRAVAEIKPVAVVLADPDWREHNAANALIKALDARDGPFMPVLARVQDGGQGGDAALPTALPIAVDEPSWRLVARLRSALRVRTLHTTVLRRTGRSGKSHGFPSRLLDHATVLCMGRGRSYPALSTAIGERVGLIGALSVETAARYLNARDIDGVVIGDGFGIKVTQAMLTVLAEDARFRDLPVGVFGCANADDERLSNLIQVEADPACLVEYFLPLVQVQAFENQLQRMLKSLESEGMIDPDTGLLAGEAFWRDLDRAVQEAGEGGSALSVARFSFDDIDRRASIDAARLFSRLVRNIDFACREQDGAILAAFTETDLRSAHVVARRLASILKQTMLAPDKDRGVLKPTITLATLKASDNLSTLVARVGTYPKVAVS